MLEVKAQRCAHKKKGLENTLPRKWGLKGALRKEKR